MVLAVALRFGVLPEDVENRMSKHWWDLYHATMIEVQR